MSSRSLYLIISVFRVGYTRLPMITQISEKDAHKLSSGQLIIDLTAAVKELVENAIDAKSSLIQVTIKDYGLDSVQVSDDGVGISVEDHPFVCSPYYTSKLSSFQDLQAVSTLGFRGEAMSSLCSISNVSIVTCPDPDVAACKLEYDHSGKLIKSSPIPAKKGTEVTISNVFENLPVRRKELVKHAKRDFYKLMTVLQSYAVINTQRRFMVNHITAKGKKNQMLATQGTSLKGNLVNVFGAGALNGLIPINLKLNISGKYSDEFELSAEGYISNCSFGQGRASSDRQLFFINGRPVDLAQLSKKINEAYKTFNHLQYPMIILNLKLDPNYLDINVTPDKRTIMIHYEDQVLESLIDALINEFDSQSHIIPKQETSTMVDSSMLQGPAGDTSVSQRKRREIYSTINERTKRLKDTSLHVQDANDTTAELSLFVNDDFEDLTGTTELDQVTGNDEEVVSTTFFSPSTAKTLQDSQLDETDDLSNKKEKEESSENDYPEGKEVDDQGASTPKRDSDNLSITRVYSVEDDDHQEPEDVVLIDEEHIDEEQNVFDGIKVTKKSIDEEAIVENGLENQKESDEFELVDAEPVDEEGESDHADKIEHNSPTAKQLSKHRPQLVADKFEESRKQNDATSERNLLASYSSTLPILNFSRAKRLNSQRYVGTVAIESQQIAQQFASNASRLINAVNSEKTSLEVAKDDITNKEIAEETLTMRVSKMDFLRMKVVGQFNLGFIIVTKKSTEGKQDLFIVDQHASDEKYNFENFQKNTQFLSQPLVVPQFIELNLLDELLVQDNIEIFNKNGFSIKFLEDNEAGKRIQLLSIPMSKGTVFDIGDFHELVHLIKENQGISKENLLAHVRPSKIRSMFAMRACRASIMIGKSLSMKTMTTVVHHLSGLDKPWNCPHGRPTMRHLIELSDLKPFQDDYLV
ncbi:BA75_03195T0 [Komagataella pastoris]|uniref:BA75_03195T0 n=1 Tax=Komagataella pastoris TaxID=4922 RepID=A0A1B2JDL8_PICPA|nr:BA75_03195T0 [Komagataella pastoris]